MCESESEVCGTSRTAMCNPHVHYDRKSADVRGQHAACMCRAGKPVVSVLARERGRAERANTNTIDNFSLSHTQDMKE